VFPLNVGADDLVATVDRTSSLAPTNWTTVAGRTPSGGWTNAAPILVEALSTNVFRVSEALTNSSQRYFRLRFNLSGGPAF
jgi:hypothetical protein